jgi:cystathionine beta-lyase family protein involved in aluminum resistance
MTFLVPACLGCSWFPTAVASFGYGTQKTKCTILSLQRSNVMRVYGEGRSSNRARWSSTPDKSGSAVMDDQIHGESLRIDPPMDLLWDCLEQTRPEMDAIDKMVLENTKRVQHAFREGKVGPHHFQGSTGYGHGDLGRSALDEIMARIMGAESAAVRIQFVSGTHAIAAGLFACLRPGDELLAVAGSPYDTLEEVIGIRGQENCGSLMDFGVSYRKLDLKNDGTVDFDSLGKSVTPYTKVALIQRSCGYALRPTLKISDIERIVKCVKKQNPNTIVVVDNCYGEFTDVCEPPAVGADLCMGSFIKNPGGTIATGGGYVAGNSELVERAVSRMSAPGVGMDAGCVPGETLRLMFQGLYMAPATVGEALKSGRLIARVFDSMGYHVLPQPGISDPWSFITAIEMKNEESMVSFCKAVQKCCPVGSYVQPVPGVTAGYGDEVIFADGTFIDGSTAEMSADGPIRPPYVVYCQGGFHMSQWVYVLEYWLREANSSDV